MRWTMHSTGVPRASVTVMLSLLTFALFASTAGAQSVPWLTRGNTNGRTGWNNQETLLTQETVIANGISLVAVVPLCCDARGMEAQPLVLPGVKTQSGVLDVLVLPSMSNFIRGVDAHTGEELWGTQLGVSVTGSNAIDLHNIYDHWGCLSTGVIDPDTDLLYQVCWTYQDKTGDPKTAHYLMYVVNLVDGTPAGNPALIDGLDFNAAMRKARSSAALITPKGQKNGPGMHRFGA